MKLYRDTLNYAPIDVIKGIDLITKKVVLGDDAAPKDYSLRPKCKFCQNFSASNEQCKAALPIANYIACADMNASTCESFAWANN